MIIEVKGGSLADDEIEQYKAFALNKYKRQNIEKLIIEVDGEFVNLNTVFAPAKFERVRRITGYLVGTLDRFNDAKRAEVGDRTPHGIEYDDHTVSGLID